MTIYRGISRLVAVLGLAWLAIPGTAPAAELALGWQAAPDEATAGYDLEVLDLSGALLFTLDAGNQTRVTVAGLADGVTYTFRVRPYDERGVRAGKPSSELVTSPRPRVDAVEGAILVEGVPALLQVRGANFLPGARVVSLREGVKIGAQQVHRHDLLVVEMAAALGTVVLPEDLLVVNPVRKTEDYLRIHAAVLDLDASGLIDEKDQDLVRGAFGVRAGQTEYSGALDPNGDGVIDGEDLALVKAMTGREVYARKGGP